MLPLLFEIKEKRVVVNRATGKMIDADDLAVLVDQNSGLIRYIGKERSAINCAARLKNPYIKPHLSNNAELKIITISRFDNTIQEIVLNAIVAKDLPVIRAAVLYHKSLVNDKLAEEREELENDLLDKLEAWMHNDKEE